MKARNRIKPLLTLCCALLLVAAGVFGTLAYLTGTDTVNNTFTVGNVKITLADAKYFAYDAKADTLTYYFYYTDTVSAPTADVALPVLFDKVTLPEWVTNDQLATLENFQIAVVAEAIQADGFANAGAAWAAFNG